MVFNVPSPPMMTHKILKNNTIENIIAIFIFHKQILFMKLKVLGLIKII